MSTAFWIQHILSTVSSLNYWKKFWRLDKLLCYSMTQDSLLILCVWILPLELLQPCCDHEESDKRNFCWTLNICIQTCLLHDPELVIWQRVRATASPEEGTRATAFQKTSQSVEKLPDGEFVTVLSRLNKLTWGIAVSCAKLHYHQSTLNWQSK